MFLSDVPVKRCFLDELKVKDTAVFPMGFEGGTRPPRRKPGDRRTTAAPLHAATESGARQPGICKVGDSSAPASIIEKTATVRGALSDGATHPPLCSPLGPVRERWSCFLRQAVKVDSAMKRVIHHEDAETVFG